MSTEYKIHLQVIAAADDDGGNEANIDPSTITSHLSTLNQTYAPAAIRFLFNETNGFLKVNSTAINRDFTLLESPNVGNDQWDHKPNVDSDSHAHARDEAAKQFPGRLVLIYRNRKKLVQDKETGLWSVDTKRGGSSGADAHYVNMSTASDETSLAHEIGHYLQLPHTFVEGVQDVADAAAKIKQFVEAGNPKADGLNALDGDRNWVLDTPADAAGSIFVSLDLEKCGPDGDIAIPVMFSDSSSKTYTLQPNRSLISSYFGCGDPTISPHQARRVRDGLEMGVRHDLVGIRPPGRTLVRGETVTAGAIEELAAAQVREGRIATAVRDKGGELKVIIWDVSDDGDTVTRRGSGSAGNIHKVSMCSLGLNLLATAVSDSDNQLKVIVWRVDESGNVTRLGTGAPEPKFGPLLTLSMVKDVVAGFIGRYNYMATVSWKVDGTLLLHVWRVTADGKITLKQTAETGEATQLGPVCGLAGGDFVTYLRDSEDKLKLIRWRYDEKANTLTRLGDERFEGSPVSALSGCALTRQTGVAAVRVENGNLRLFTHEFPDTGTDIENQGVAEAGKVGDVGVCRLGIEMFVTAVKDGGNRLKLILWRVSDNHPKISRVDDATTDEAFSRLAICPVSKEKLTVAIRDGNGNLKLVIWRVPTEFSVDLDNVSSAISFRIGKPSAAQGAKLAKALVAGHEECDGSAMF